MLEQPNFPLAATALFIAGLCSGCAATSTEKTTTADMTQVQTKIGFAIGRETGSFSIIDQRAAEAPGGYNRTDYAVSTTEGTKYNCYILEPSGFGKVMSFGMTSGTDAVCSMMNAGSVTGTATQTNPACNSLLKAAGKC